MNADKAYHAAYNAAHKEEIRAQQAAYYAAHKEERKAYYAAHKEEIKAQQAAYYAAHKEKRKAQQAAYDTAHREERKAYRAALKIEAFNAYGGPICICCGEDDPDFLTIEHSNGDGAKHRKENGPKIYSWLKRNGYPQNRGLEVLCFNCQFGRRLNRGRCPHEG